MVSRGVRYSRWVLEHWCDWETSNVVGKERAKTVDSMCKDTPKRIHGTYCAPVRAESCKETRYVLESGARFGKRPGVAGLKCQPEEFGFDPRVKRKSVSSSLYW